ncbi:MAG: hypothetical protein KDB82_14380, partial [Planctomycetes bacterium]|nr:hypothetical protein [Planctomycetota bacterium]
VRIPAGPPYFKRFLAASPESCTGGCTGFDFYRRAERRVGAVGHLLVHCVKIGIGNFRTARYL